MLRRLLSFLKEADGSVSTKTLRAGTWVGISNLLSAPLGFIRSIALARLLSPEIFGLWAICMMVIRGLEVLTQTGFGAALIHRQGSFEEARGTAFTLSAIRGVALACATLALAPAAASFYDNDALLPLIAVLAAAFVFTGFQNINSVLYQKQLDFRLLVYLEQAQLVFNFVFVLALAYILRSIWALVIGHVIATLVSTWLSYLIVPGKPRFELNRKIAWELFHYGKYITGLSVVIFITTEIDNAVIGKILGMEALGFYVLAYTLANLPTTHLSKILSKVLFPAYSQLQDNIPALSEAFCRAVQVVSLVTVPIAFLFMVLSEELITILYGERWRPASAVLAILSVFGTLRAISSLSGYLYNAIGRPNIPFQFNLAKLVIIAIAIVPATIQFGIVGAAAAVTVPLSLQYGVTMAVASRMLRVSSWRLFAPTLKYAIASALIAGAVLYIKGIWTEVTVVSVGAMVLGSGSAYCLLCWRDIMLFVSMLRRGRPSTDTRA